MEDNNAIKLDGDDNFELDLDEAVEAAAPTTWKKQEQLVRQDSGSQTGESLKTSKPINAMSVDELAEAIFKVCSADTAQRFCEAEIDGSIVGMLSAADLAELEPIMGRRLKLQKLFGVFQGTQVMPQVAPFRIGQATCARAMPVEEVLVSQMEKATRKRERKEPKEGGGTAGRKTSAGKFDFDPDKVEFFQFNGQKRCRVFDKATQKFISVSKCSRQADLAAFLEIEKKHNIDSGMVVPAEDGDSESESVKRQNTTAAPATQHDELADDDGPALSVSSSLDAGAQDGSGDVYCD